MLFTELWKEGWSAAIVNHLRQSTLAMLVAWLLTLVLKRNQARTRYWIWMAASLKRWSRAWWAIRATLQSASRISLPIDVPVFSTSRTIEPGIVGIFRPALLLPETILDRLSAPQLGSILAHESCHVQRRDNLTAAIHMAIEAIFWFHPAVWWIERRLIQEREQACDEAVLQLGNDAEVYAETILNVCKFYIESPMASMSGVTGSDLKQRIARIMAKQVAIKLDITRKLLLTAAGIAAIWIPMLFGLLHIPEVNAQRAPANPTENISATWQGTLHTNRDLRLVVRIATGPDGELRAIFYNIDGPPGAIPAISTAFDGRLLKFDVPFATYEGTVSADGNSITGTWRQGPNMQSLNFARATQGSEWTIPQPPPRLPPMATDANPTFEVATIKPSRPDEHGPRFWFEHRRFSVTHVSLSQLVQFAYGLQQGEIAGVPDWFNSETYNISAEPNGKGEPSIKQWQAMVKQLMADRFQLKFHYEKRELAVYALTLAKGGPKLIRSQGDPSQLPGLGFGPPGNMGAKNAIMADVAEAMQQGALDRPVIDQTGLTGRFDLRLTWTPDEMHSSTESADAPPNLFTAIQEELGLKLVSTKALVNVIVVDHVERPSAN